MTRWRLVLVLALALTVSSGLTACGARGLTFADSRLEFAIRVAIDKPDGAIRQSDLEELVFLDAGGRGITDLTGLESCTNLTTLVLVDNEIRDISPLVSLTKLRVLVLDGNPLSTQSLTLYIRQLEEMGVAVSPSGDPEDRLRQVGSLVVTGRYEEAIEEYSKFIQSDPNVPGPYISRGLAYWNLAVSESAIGGSVYAMLGELQIAIIDFSTAFNLDPEMLGEFERAIADFSTAIDIDPELRSAYYSRARAYHSVEQYDLALADWTKVIELDPGDTAGYVGRAGIFSSSGQYDLAIADCTKVIELAPYSPVGYLTRAGVYLKKERWEMALADSDRVIQTGLDNLIYPAYYQRGLAYKGLDRIDEAITDFRKYRSLSLYRYEREMAQQQINELKE